MPTFIYSWLSLPKNTENRYQVLWSPSPGWSGVVSSTIPCTQFLLAASSLAFCAFSLHAVEVMDKCGVALSEKYIFTCIHLKLTLLYLDSHLYWVSFRNRLNNSLCFTCFNTPVYKGFDSYWMVESCATEQGKHRNVFRAGKQGCCTEPASSIMLSIFSHSHFLLCTKCCIYKVTSNPPRVLYIYTHRERGSSRVL